MKSRPWLQLSGFLRANLGKSEATNYHYKGSVVFDAMPKKKQEIKAQTILHGVAASPGIAMGSAFVLADDQVKAERRMITAAEVPQEIEKLKTIIETTRQELLENSIHAIGESAQDQERIAEVHRMVLDDEYFIGEVNAMIRNELVNADYAFQERIDKYTEQLRKRGGHFAEIADELHDIKHKVIRRFNGDRRQLLNQAEDAVIVVSHDLTTSVALTLNRHKIKGIATDLGGKTSHAALLARAYRVPAVVGLRDIIGAIKNDDRVIVDGNNGVVLVNPDKSTSAQYRAKRNKWLAAVKKLDHLRDLPARTIDNRDLTLAANLEYADEVEDVLAHGAAGVGLLRTEYLYLGRDCLPDEEEQYREYSRIAKSIKPHPVIIRTMDVGGDKSPQCIDIPPEANPMLGWRAIRISLERPEIFIAQIKAILRANTRGNMRILLPMISGIEQLDEALALIEKAKRQLRKQGQNFEPETEVGVMIEIPSAALIADAIAERVDFLSIGTNDLVQYLLAVDRGNERIAHLFENLHPAVLRVIKNVIDAGHSKGIWVGMCGEMAADRLATALLVGMKIDELSVSPIDVPEIKKIIRHTSFHEAEKLAQQVLNFSTAKEIIDFMRQYMRRRFKDMVL
jgi:phosphotransferase system enzyme I (PtsI)